MVAGKVKAAMGFQRSPATPKHESARLPSCSPASTKSSASGASATTTKNSGAAAAFARSFGVYFPKSSAQVQPRPPDVGDLIRLIEDLQERESRLQTEILEYKLLKETASIVPFLESQISSKDQELELLKHSFERVDAENRELRAELEVLKPQIQAQNEGSKQKEKRIREMEVEIEDLRRTISEQSIGDSRRFSGVTDECSSSQRFQGLIDASSRSNLVRSLRRSPKSSDIAPNPEGQKPEPVDPKGDDGNRCEREENPRPRVPRVPKPPPTPSFSSSSSSSSSDTASSSPTMPGLPPPPPPPPKSSAGTPMTRAPPPPPPPPPTRGSKASAASVRRVPEVVEFYHSLMRRDSKRESGAGLTDAPAAANARNMIGEIENRSAHLLAIKSDVEMQGDFIRFLIKEVNNAAFSNIEDLVAFVKWLDDELSFLVDERAVLKHFDWPEQKADAMREAAFGYCDVKKLSSEASSFRDDPRQPCSSSLKKLQALLEKLEHGVDNLARMREGATKRYKGFRIPWEWMLETGIVSQIKLASVKLAMKYMKRVSSELEANGSGSPEEEDLMLQGVRFAFRVHQFAGGFDVETMRAFQELKDKARSFHHHHNKTYSRSTSC
ncbi:Formin homology 2 domain (FH2 domain)-containing protein [Dioscorea alata]|uniref:Formin homology 2 domain (FH2 domain)-containing protein n=1 Tax=Dioscorea alata TaxID=55571 RepID=A0ACB7UCW2_DIOAL|nr:Formin homology 2 domain (FH2 domain)-containing protein [Dioscorea alata]